MQCSCYWDVCAKMSIRKNEDLMEEVKIGKIFTRHETEWSVRRHSLCYLIIVQSFSCFKIVFEIEICCY